MRLKLAAIALGFVVVASAFGASAFTTASVDRTTSISVASDTNGLIGFAAGNASTGVVSTTSSGELVIDFSGDSANAAGVNDNATFTVGENVSTASNSNAFVITNNDDAQHDFNVQYNPNDAAIVGDSTQNVQFAIYKGTKLVGVASEESASGQILVNSTESVYVDVTVNTRGTSVSDLSGNLNVTA
ncbi:hypothetical protein [Halarchaeum sp. P4]|uniref:hypothetical protein n=1 Tax=Halarchaeum sp. P4 TaxID=3421639 RepID=UPI003EBD53DC